MNAKIQTDCARLPAILFAVCIFAISNGAGAQNGPAHAPLPPPETAPESRLTVSPSEFESWLSGTQAAGEPTSTNEPRDEGPTLATAPPAAPAPRLVAPPPPPALAPTPERPRATPAKPPETSAPAAAPTPTPPAAPASKQDKPPATAVQPSEPPPAPQPGSAPPRPDEPQITTLPPDAPNAPAPAEPPPLEPLAAPDVVTILYEAGAMEVPDAARAALDKAAAWMQRNPEARMQIVGYAEGKTAAMASEAKRTSLYRTLAVRKYLVESGVLSTRMNLCAMGATAKAPPENKVQLFMEAGSGAGKCEDFAE